MFAFGAMIQMSEVNLDRELAEKSDEEIVNLLVDLPEETEISRSPLASAMINGKDERYLYRWAMICSMVAHLVKSGERLASFLLEVVNSLRRIPGFHFQSVLDLLDEAAKAIEGLESSPRRDRLAGLALYHRGLLYETAGKFDLAAQYHREAAAKASEGSFERAVSAYMVAHMEMCAAIVADTVTKEMWTHLNDATTEPLKTHPQWKFNVWHDHLQFMWYCGGSPSEFAQEAALFCAALAQAEESVRNGTLDAGNFLAAYTLYANRKYSEAFAVARAAADRPGGETGACFDCLLLCASIKRCFCEFDEERKLLDEVRDRRVLGGHIQRAVAERATFG